MAFCSRARTLNFEDLPYLIGTIVRHYISPLTLHFSRTSVLLMDIHFTSILEHIRDCLHNSNSLRLSMPQPRWITFFPMLIFLSPFAVVFLCSLTEPRMKGVSDPCQMDP